MTQDTQSTEVDYLTIEKLADEVRPLFGQIVLIHDTTPAVLHGVGMDPFDLYYIAAPIGRAKNTIWHSAVGRCSGLKEHLPEEMYARMAQIFDLNTTTPPEFQMMVHMRGDAPVPYDASRHNYEISTARIEHRALIAKRNAEDDADDSDFDITDLFSD